MEILRTISGYTDSLLDHITVEFGFQLFKKKGGIIYTCKGIYRNLLKKKNKILHHLFLFLLPKKITINKFIYFQKFLYAYIRIDHIYPLKILTQMGSLPTFYSAFSFCHLIDFGRTSDMVQTVSPQIHVDTYSLNAITFGGGFLGGDEVTRAESS